MTERINCPIKLNLTLRVLYKRADNLHEIFTVFWKKNADEILTIYPVIEENIADIVSMPGVPLNGENLATKALDFARQRGTKVPPLRVTIDKKYPLGSGIGAGSGNAAALLIWLREHYGFSATVAEIAMLGADVSFLESRFQLALAHGSGEIMSPLAGIPDYITVLAFPYWYSGTQNAYAKLDWLREEQKIQALSLNECENEARRVLSALSSKRKIGLLPNDFLEIFAGEQLAAYYEAFAISDEHGALAWGLCGSGSAMFALCAGNTEAELIKEKFKQLDWVKKTAKLE